MKRKALDIKKKILGILQKEKELSLKALEIKINTGSQTVQTQLEELEFFELVEITKHKRSEKTGRPYTSVKLKN